MPYTLYITVSGSGEEHTIRTGVASLGKCSRVVREIDAACKWGSVVSEWPGCDVYARDEESGKEYVFEDGEDVCRWTPL